MPRWSHTLECGVFKLCSVITEDGCTTSGCFKVFSFEFVIFFHDVSLISALSIVTGSSVLKMIDFRM